MDKKSAVVIWDNKNYYDAIKEFLVASGYMPSYIKTSEIKTPKFNILDLQPDLVIQQFSHSRMGPAADYAFTKRIMHLTKDSKKNIALLVLDILPKYDKAMELVRQSHEILSGSKVQFSYDEMVYEKEKFMKYLTDEYWNAPARSRG
ncbi:MAG: hypothetical protein WC916_00770 [Candidatus Woesearchaeota archaeon]